MEEDLILVAFSNLPLVAAALVFLFFVHFRQHKRAGFLWLRLVVGNALVLLFLICTLMFAGECYYRFWYDTTDSFGLAKVTKRWFQRHYRLNSIRVRDTIDYATLRPPGKRRVTFIGDSFTAGHGVKNVNDRFANLIRNEHGNEWDIHVLARNGWDTGHQLNFLANELIPASQRRYQFDQVVLVYCLNDVSDLISDWQEIQRRIYATSEPGPLAKHSFLLNTWHYRVFASRDPDVSNYYQFTLAGYEPEIWNRQQQRLIALRDLVRRGGGQLSVVTFPFLHSLGPDYPFEAVHVQLDAFWKSIGVPHLDLLDVYERFTPGEVVVNRYDAHPNPPAHALAASAISEFIGRNMTATE